ncbi:unnamed protein product [Peniophora sp. CBMAI 1063]|nr:unnamed protein product [Peniophora sp. CBMAI 1063]
MADEPKPEEMPAQALFWTTYLKDAEEEDKYLPKSWEANTGSVLTFTGLFAATVAAFIIESYKSLSPDSGDQTVVLLTQLLAVAANASSHTPIDTTHAIASVETFKARPTAIVVNVLWFSSLLIALVCALLSTLIQEWSRDYVRDINRRRTLDESARDRAYNHMYIRMGVDKYGMDSVVYCVTALVHLAVFLFVVGLAVFLFPFDGVVAAATTAVLGFFLLLYLAASISPLVDGSSPYRTPATYLFAGIYFLFLSLCRAVVRFCALLRPNSAKPHKSDPVPAFRELVSRAVTDHENYLDSGPRFKFAWDRASRHLLQDQLPDLLRDLQSLMDGMETQAGRKGARTSNLYYHRTVLDPLDCLSSDESFMNTMQNYSNDLLGRRTGEFALDFFKIAGLLSWSIFAADPADHSTPTYFQWSVTKALYLDILSGLALVMECKSFSAIDRLRARVCLAIARRALVGLCSAARKRTRFPDLTTDDVTPAVSTFDESEEPPLVPMYEHLNGQFSDNRIILLMMQSHVDRALYYIDDFGYEALAWLKDNTVSCHPVPLHDGDCCRSWRSILIADGWAHDAASGLLSLIARFIEAPADVQRKAGDVVTLMGWTLFRYWDSSALFEDYLDIGPPSSEFITLLRDVELDECFVWYLAAATTHPVLPSTLAGPKTILRTLPTTYNSPVCVYEITLPHDQSRATWKVIQS